MEQRTKTATKKGTGRSTPTDIEKFVDAPGRKELVAQVRKKIDELGIEYLYLQFVSVTGHIMGDELLSTRRVYKLLDVRGCGPASSFFRGCLGTLFHRQLPIPT